MKEGMRQGFKSGFFGPRKKAEASKGEDSAPESGIHANDLEKGLHIEASRRQREEATPSSSQAAPAVVHHAPAVRRHDSDHGYEASGGHQQAPRAATAVRSVPSYGAQPSEREGGNGSGRGHMTGTSYQEKLAKLKRASQTNMEEGQMRRRSEVNLPDSLSSDEDSGAKPSSFRRLRKSPIDSQPPVQVAGENQGGRQAVAGPDPPQAPEEPTCTTQTRSFKEESSHANLQDGNQGQRAGATAKPEAASSRPPLTEKQQKALKLRQEAYTLHCQNDLKGALRCCQMADKECPNDLFNLATLVAAHVNVEDHTSALVKAKEAEEVVRKGRLREVGDELTRTCILSLCWWAHHAHLAAGEEEAALEKLVHMASLACRLRRHDRFTTAVQRYEALSRKFDFEEGRSTAQADFSPDSPRSRRLGDPEEELAIRLREGKVSKQDLLDSICLSDLSEREKARLRDDVESVAGRADLMEVLQELEMKEQKAQLMKEKCEEALRRARQNQSEADALRRSPGNRLSRGQ